MAEFVPSIWIRVRSFPEPITRRNDHAPLEETRCRGGTGVGHPRLTIRDRDGHRGMAGGAGSARHRFPGRRQSSRAAVLLSLSSSCHRLARRRGRCRVQRRESLVTLLVSRLADCELTRAVFAKPAGCKSTPSCLNSDLAGFCRLGRGGSAPARAGPQPSGHIHDTPSRCA